MKKGDRVEYKEEIGIGDNKFPMVIVEVNGDRVIVETLIPKFPIRPTRVVNVDELILV
jgi:hypothetical protein